MGWVELKLKAISWTDIDSLSIWLTGEIKWNIQRQTITWTNPDLLSTEYTGTHLIKTWTEWRNVQ